MTQIKDFHMIYKQVNLLQYITWITTLLDNYSCLTSFMLKKNILMKVLERLSKLTPECLGLHAILLLALSSNIIVKDTTNTSKIGHVDRCKKVSYQHY